MNKMTKAAWIVAGTAFSVGLLFHGAGALMGGRAESRESDPGGIRIGGDHGVHVGGDGLHIGGEHGVHIGGRFADWTDGLRDDDEDMENGTVIRDGKTCTGTDLAAFTDVDVELELGDVTVEEGEGYGVSLSWNVPTAGKGFEMAYENKDGKLTVWTEESSGKMPGGGSWDSSAIITVPKGTVLGKVELKTELGDVTWTAEAGAREAELKTDLGDVTCGGLTADELTAESDLGDVKVALPGGREDYRWDLETSMGDVRLDGKTVSGGLGTITSQDGGGPRQVKAHSDLGNVAVSFDE